MNDFFEKIQTLYFNDKDFEKAYELCAQGLNNNDANWNLKGSESLRNLRH